MRIKFTVDGPNGEISRIEDTMKFETTKSQFLKGKPVWRARFPGKHDHLAEGPTKAAAEEAAEAFLVELVEQHARRAYFPSPDGKVVLAVRFAHGEWGYDIVRPGEANPWGGTCVGTGESFEDCCDKARRHAASYDGQDPEETHTRMVIELPGMAAVKGRFVQMVTRHGDLCIELALDDGDTSFFNTAALGPRTRRNPT